MIMVLKGKMALKTLVMAEIIIEFFDGLSVERIIQFGTRHAREALSLLKELKLIRIENSRVVLTSTGKLFVKLPYSNEKVGKRGG